MTDIKEKLKPIYYHLLSKGITPDQLDRLAVTPAFIHTAKDYVEDEIPLSTLTSRALKLTNFQNVMDEDP